MRMVHSVFVTSRTQALIEIQRRLQTDARILAWRGGAFIDVYFTAAARETSWTGALIARGSDGTRSIVQARSRTALKATQLALRTGVSTGAGAAEHVDRIDACSVVQTGKTQTFVDICLAVEVRVARRTDTVVVSRCQDLTGTETARIRCTSVDSQFTARSCVTNGTRALITHTRHDAARAIVPGKPNRII